MNKHKSVSKAAILKIAAEMTANDFINEFNSLITIDSMDNTMDANDGMVNVAIPVNDSYHLYILFVHGRFDSYSH